MNTTTSEIPNNSGMQKPLPAALTEEARRICDDLLVGMNGPMSVLVTGPFGGEGATTMAAAIATGLSHMPGTKTLLVDANIRTPQLHTFFGVPLEPGLLTWDGQSDPPYVKIGSFPGLWLLPAGRRVGASVNGEADSAGFQYPQLLTKLMERCRKDFEYVVVDAAPVTKYIDAKIVARLVSGVLFVVEADRTRLDHLAYAKEQMTRAQANLIGAILNRHGRFWPWKRSEGHG